MVHTKIKKTKKNKILGGNPPTRPKSPQPSRPRYFTINTNPNNRGRTLKIKKESPSNSKKRITSKSKSPSRNQSKTPEIQPITQEPDPKENECPICLEEFDNENTNLFIITNCNHKFHLHCLYEHCKNKNKNIIDNSNFNDQIINCPLCNGQIADTCNIIVKKKEENTPNEPIDIEKYCKSHKINLESLLDFSVFGDKKRSIKEIKEIKEQLKNLTYNPYWKSCIKYNYGEEVVFKDKYKQILEKIKCWVEKKVEIE